MKWIYSTIHFDVIFQHLQIEYLTYFSMLTNLSRWMSHKHWNTVQLKFVLTNQIKLRMMVIWYQSETKTICHAIHFNSVDNFVIKFLRFMKNSICCGNKLNWIESNIFGWASQNNWILSIIFIKLRQISINLLLHSFINAKYHFYFSFISGTYKISSHVTNFMGITSCATLFCNQRSIYWILRKVNQS